MSHDHSKESVKYVEAFEILHDNRPTSPTQPVRPMRETYWRWIALIMMNLIVLGDFVALEGPQPIETQIRETLNINEEQYSMLYSSWALPSIFSPVLGGFLTDRFGVRPTLILFSLAVTIGQFIHTIGGYAMNFNLMIAGRTIYALGTDPLNVAQIVITNKWFQGKEVALAMSISGLTFGLGRGLNSLLTPILYEMTKHLGTPMMFQAILCLGGTLAAIIMARWDRKNEEIELSIDSTYLSRAQDSGEKIRFEDIKHFKPIVWTLVLNFGLLYGCSFSFNAFMNAFYHERYGFSNIEAGSMISISFMVMAAIAIIFGKIIDSCGYRAKMLMYNSLFGVFGCFFFFIFPECPRCMSLVIPQILFGIQAGIGEAAIYPCLPLVLEERFLGTGYGLFFVLENVLVLILPLVGAYIKDVTTSPENDGYFGMILFFFVWNCFIVQAAVRLLLQSNKLSRVLDKPLSTKDLNETASEENSELLK